MKHLTLLLIFTSFFLAHIVTLAQEKIRVACVGNSVTYGYGINNRQQNCYPAQLQKLLGEKYEVGNFGHSGATLLKKGHNPYWKKEEFERAKAFQADIVVIHLGLNDTDPRNWPNHRDDFTKDYSHLIEAFRGQPNAKVPKVWICKMTPIFHPHPRFQSGTRDWFWQIQERIQIVAQSTKVGLIDLHTPLYNRPDLFPDALHPNAEGAQILARTVYGEITGDFGELSLPAVFADHMVLQRNVSIPVWGTAKRGELIKVKLANQQIETHSDEHGKWRVEFPAMKAGGPFQLEIEGQTSKIKIKDILIGDVWLCSGQSNMAWRLEQSQRAQEEIPKANNPNIRLYNMKATAWADNTIWSKEVLEQINKLNFFEAEWEVCSPETAAKFSGIGYHFGYKLHEETGVPIGLILNAMGGSPNEAWIDRKSLEFHPQLVDILYNWKNNDRIMKWCRERGAHNISASDNHMQRHPFEPAYLFESGIQPISGFAMKGVIWYQGESNAHNVELYEESLPVLVKSWRKAWGCEFPFYYVQLSSLNRPSWPHFRDAQRRLMNKIPNSGMVVCSDIGHPTDVHPQKKKEVGERLALWSLAKDYQKSITYSGPLFKSCEFTNGKSKVSFVHGNELTTSDGKELKSFELAGEDMIFKPAKAKIYGNRVIVWSDKISKPKMVRYGWKPYSDGNLVNGEGLPASTFSTEFEERASNAEQKKTNEIK